jgi:HlyD family secretion protein
MNAPNPALAAAAAPARLPGPASAPQTPEKRWSAAAQMRVGLITLFVLVFGFGAWATFASISGAVVAPGRLKVETNRQVVQHLDGGIVAEIAVQEGDVVPAGSVLVRLDDTRLNAELAIVESQLFEVMARIGRLEAEVIGAEAPLFDRELLDVAEERPEVARLVEGQTGLFEARAETARRETDQLRERQTQIREEIRGAAAQRESLDRQLDFIEQELVDQRSLLDRGLTQASRVLSLEREKARLEGQIGTLTAQAAQLAGRITEIDIQLTGRDATRREEAITQLRDLRTNEAELKERRISTLDIISRLDIRAPREGVVLGLTVFTVGAVVQPAEPLMYIVPTEVDLVVEARMEPINIDQVYPGQPARLRFSAFNQRTTPEVDSTVLKVAPDALTDEATGVSYYPVELAISEDALEQLGADLTLVAGMPVDAFIQTGERSPLSYLLRPLTDFFARSMREE